MKRMRTDSGRICVVALFQIIGRLGRPDDRFGVLAALPDIGPGRRVQFRHAINPTE